MTDLPQLQTLLVDAAVKRRRFRRVRRTGAGLLVAAAVAAVAVFGTDTAPDDRAVPVTPPSPAPAMSVEDAFGAFGAPDGIDVQALRPGDRVRRLGQPETAYADSYLVLRGDRLCLAVRDTFECRAAADLLSGHEILFNRVGGRMYAVFPNGVKTVKRQWTSYEPASFAVSRNLVVFTAPSGRGRLDWRAPDGTAAHIAIAGTTLEDAASYYSVLPRGEQPGDGVNGLAGARWLISLGDVNAWMVPRRNAVCLIVRLGQRRNSGCRAPVGNTALPLVVALDGYATIALPDGSEVLSPPPPGGVTTSTMLLARGAREFRYRSPYGDEQTVTLPTETDYVLNGFEKRPEDLPRR
jgi:hypothetical protein